MSCFFVLFKFCESLFYQQKVYATPEYLLKFFGNLLLGENNELKNRYLRIDAVAEVQEELCSEMTNNVSGQKNDSGDQKRWSEKVVRLLDLIKENPTITRKELSESLEINPSAVQKHINKLKTEGIITREGSDKKGRWEILQNGGNIE